MTLSRRGFLAALASAPVVAVVPAAPVVQSNKAGLALQGIAGALPKLAEPAVFAGPPAEGIRIDLDIPKGSPTAPEVEPSEPDMTLFDYLNTVNGRPYDENYHCLAHAGHVQWTFFGRRLPLIPLPEGPIARHDAIHSHPAMQDWQQVSGPAHGAMVLMSPRAVDRVDCHIGVSLLIPEPVVTHTDAPQGVCVDDLMTLRARGWHPTFWMPVAA